MLTGARLHAMRPFLLTPSSAPAAPSTLSRLLLPLHLRTRSDSFRVHPASNPHPPNNRTISLLRRGRFFATSPSSQVGWNRFPALRPVPPISRLDRVSNGSGQAVRSNVSAAGTNLAYDDGFLFLCDADGDSYRCLRWRGPVRGYPSSPGAILGLAYWHVKRVCGTQLTMRTITLQLTSKSGILGHPKHLLFT
jgi:hypothetical protein